MLLLLTLAACFQCGTYTFTGSDGLYAEGYEHCGPLAGSFAAPDGSEVLLTLVPTTDDAEMDEALVAAAPELLLHLPADRMQAQAVFGPEDLRGTASAQLTTTGGRAVANLVEGELRLVRPLSPSILGEQRWAMEWSLRFEGEELEVRAEGSDKIDVVLDSQSAGF